MPTILNQFRKGSTVISFGQGVYTVELNSWAPGLALRSQSLIGGDGPYTEATESWRVRITETSQARALAAYHALITMLDDAQAFYDGVATTPVVWYVQLAGMTVPVADMVLGYAGGRAPIEAPPTIMKELDAFIISGIRLSFRRKGRFVREAEETATTSATTDIGQVQTCTFSTSADTASPLRLEIGRQDFNEINVISMAEGVFMVGSTSTTFAAQQASALASGAFTSVNNAAAFPSATNILRYTPAVLTRVTTASASRSFNGTQLLILLEARNNTVGKQYLVDVMFEGLGGQTWRSPTIIIDDATTSVRIHTVGIISTPREPLNIRLGVQANATGGTLDVDRIWLINLRDPMLSIMVHGSTNLASTFVLGSTNARVALNHNYLTALEPTVDVREDSGQFALFQTLDGNLSLNTVGSNVYTVWLLPYGTAWAPNDGVGRLDLETRAYRNLASLSPR